MKGACESCLFYIDALPDTVICIGGKRTKEYVWTKTNCKKWVENTPENADKYLKFFGSEDEQELTNK